MIDLLQQFSLSQIFIFITLFILALKGIISTFDWASERGQKFFHKAYQQPRELEKTLEELKQTVQYLTKQINILIQSDRDDIKAYITKQHHFFVYQQGWIDDYSLDCIEKRYTHYKDEGGNSFVHNLMEEIRKLPRTASN